MKACTTTRPATFSEPETARRMRNQATGIGQTRSASEMTGARRSQAVIDCAPRAQLKDRDDSYPAPSPVYGADGRCRDRMTGRLIMSPLALTRAG